MPGRKWTNKELMELERLYPSNSTKKVAELLGRTEKQVYMSANIRGLKKNSSYMKAELQRQADRLRIVGTASRIVKGSVPHNKGKKMGDETYKKVQKTMFKSGHRPHNTKFDG